MTPEDVRKRVPELLSEFGGRYHAAKSGSGNGPKILRDYTQAIINLVADGIEMAVGPNDMFIDTPAYIKGSGYDFSVGRPDAVTRNILRAEQRQIANQLREGKL